MMKNLKSSLDTFKQSFQEYLWESHVVETEKELNELVELLHQPLPLSFRINLHRSDALRVMKKLMTKYQFLQNTFIHEGILVNPAHPIPWYPVENVAWQVDCGRVALSKCARKQEDVNAFHSFLLEATDIGTIDRQETVSMLPVAFLDVLPHHKVLDMCASPGSKTTQIIDFILSNHKVEHTQIATEGGLVIANELEKKRAYMLVHRLTRNTLRNVAVTLGSGIEFPGLYSGLDNNLQETNVFDRVLCDVPCSGDGTLRKNQALWKDWHIGQGLTLHTTQIELAMRGAALLKVGGLLVYSTCSFNVVENEAVVHEVLRRSDGALELVDARHTYAASGLKVRSGRTCWQVGWRSKSKSTNKGHLLSNSGKEDEKFHEWYPMYEDVPVELQESGRILRSMFPPSHDSTLKNELAKSIRLVPIDQNSGGFFLTVFRKLKDLPGPKQQGLLPVHTFIDTQRWRTPSPDYVCKICNGKGHYLRDCEKFVSDAKPVLGKKQKTEKSTEEIKETAFGSSTALYRCISIDVWQWLQGFYGLSSSPSLNPSKLYSRSDLASNIHLMDESIIKNCLQGTAINIVNTGVKLFCKVVEKEQVFYRPVEEGLGFLVPHLKKRVIMISSEKDFFLLLNAPLHVRFTELSELLCQQLSNLSYGPAIAKFEDETRTEVLPINIWIGIGAILPRVSKVYRTEVKNSLEN